MSKKAKTGLRAFLIGGTIGAIVGLLYAPQSGEKTRQVLVDEGQEIMDKTKASVKDTQDTAASIIENAQVRIDTLSKETRERLEQLQDVAKDTFGKQKESLEEGYSHAKEIVAG